MAQLSSSNWTQLFSLFGQIQSALQGCAVAEEAAQRCVDRFYREFEESVVLVRLYGTVPFAALPPGNQEFVRRLAEAKGVTLGGATPVLSLLGTRGVKPAWNDRRQSQGHVGIPLVSSAFVEAIPMIARLLVDLGVRMEWLDRPVQGVTSVHGDWSGLFHVLDAANAVDQKGRLVIPAQDFVRESGVKTVFGIGGSYPSQDLFAMIVFAREVLPRQAAERFLPLVTTLKGATSAFVQRGQIFSA